MISRHKAIHNTHFLSDINVSLHTISFYLWYICEIYHIEYISSCGFKTFFRQHSIVNKYIFLNIIETQCYFNNMGFKWIFLKKISSQTYILERLMHLLWCMYVQCSFQLSSVIFFDIDFIFVFLFLTQKSLVFYSTQQESY